MQYPASITHTTPSMVSDVSAMFVATMIFLPTSAAPTAAAPPPPTAPALEAAGAAAPRSVAPLQALVAAEEERKTRLWASGGRAE